MADKGTVEAMPQHKTEAFEDRKARKQLEEARQSGKAAPEIDVESGKMINPHNPEYITKRPWYLGESGPSLNHHAVQKKNHFITMHEADAVAKQRKKKERKDTRLQVGMWVEALFRGKNPWLPAKVLKMNLDGTADVEFENGKVQKKVARAHIKTSMAFGSMLGIEEEGKLAFDAKRDRWHGYDPTAHKGTIERYNRMDDARRKRRQELKDEKFKRKMEAKKKKEAEKADKKKALGDKSVVGSSSGGGGGGGGGGGDGTDSPTDSDGGDSDGGRRKAKESDSDSDSDSDYDTDSDAEGEDDDEADFLQRDENDKSFQSRIARQGGIGGAQMLTTVRNLRLREDTAKYLRNLDPNSAYYDPKTRSMRDNPLPNENPEELPFAGDNFGRYSGDTIELAKTSLFAWEAHAKNQDSDVNPISNPSQVEFMRRQFEEKKGKLEEDKKQSVLDKYGTGGAEKIDEGADERRMALGSTEGYVEYSRDGRVLRGAAKAVAKSKYPEDIMVNNHTMVWGSWFDPRIFRWGYGDDHSLVRNSYSTGEAGKEANDAANAGIGSAMGSFRPSRPMLEAVPADQRQDSNPLLERSKLYGEGDKGAEFDQDKLKAAIAKEEQFQKDALRHETEADDKKRKYNSMTSYEVTPEEMEAYRMKKANDFNDPMAKFTGGDDEELLEYNSEDEEKTAKKKSKKSKKKQ